MNRSRERGHLVELWVGEDGVRGVVAARGVPPDPDAVQVEVGVPRRHLAHHGDVVRAARAVAEVAVRVLACDSPTIQLGPFETPGEARKLL